MINTGLVGSLLATDPSYATLPLSLQFLTIAITLIPVSLLMGKIGRRPMFLIGAMTAFIGCLIIAYSIFDKIFSLFIVGSILLGFLKLINSFIATLQQIMYQRNLRARPYPWF